MRFMRFGFPIILLSVPACHSPILQPIAFGNLGVADAMHKAIDDLIRNDVTAAVCILDSARSVLTSDANASIRQPGTTFSFSAKAQSRAQAQSWSQAPINLIMFESLVERRNQVTSSIKAIEQANLCEMDEVSDSVDLWLERNPPRLSPDSIFVLALYFSETNDPSGTIRRVVFPARPSPNQNNTILVELLEAAG